MRHRKRFIVSDVFGDIQTFLRGGNRDVLPSYPRVIHSGFKLIIDRTIRRNAFLIKFLIIFASDPQIVKLALIQAPLLM